MMKTIKALWGMARPLIMLSVILVYGAGLLIARAEGHPLPVTPIGVGFVALLLVSLSIHYSNEYADYETDALTRPTAYSGGSGVLPRGDVPRRLAMQAAWVTLILGAGLAVGACVTGLMSLSVLVLLIIGAFFGWMYSLPPLKLAWRGWGEVDNALLGGVCLPLYGYGVVTGELSLKVALISLPFTLLVFINLLATTWADKDADQQVGKFTLATRHAPHSLRRLYGASAVGAFMMLAALQGACIPREVVWGSFLAVPLVIWGALTYTRQHHPYPTSNAMVVLLLGQMGAWYLVGS